MKKVVAIIVFLLLLFCILCMLFCPKADKNLASPNTTQTVSKTANLVESNLTKISENIDEISQKIEDNLTQISQNLEQNLSQISEQNTTEILDDIAQNANDLAEKIDENILTPIKNWFAGIFNKFKNDEKFKSIKTIENVEIFANDFGDFKIENVIKELENSTLLNQIDGFTKSVYIQKFPKSIEINIFTIPNENTDFSLDELKIKSAKAFFDTAKTKALSLDQIKQMSKDINFAKSFEIGGNADRVGEEIYNLNLSLQRAINIAQNLPNSLYKKIIAYGKYNLAFTQNTKEANAKNRRVEIEGE